MGRNKNQESDKNNLTMNNITAYQEDKLTLQIILGMSNSQAEDILSKTIVLTLNEKNEIDVLTSAYIKNILSRTVSEVTNFTDKVPDVEIVINNSITRTNAKHIFILLGDNCVNISTRSFGYQLQTSFSHRSLILLSAIYITSFTIRHIIGDNPKLPKIINSMTIDFKALFPDITTFNTQVIFEKTYLAGGGAIGNAFLYALKEFNVKGELVIADPDPISDGNLNRCIWFDKSVLGKNKAEVLVNLAQKDFNSLKLIPHPDFLNTVINKESDEKWLKRLIVAVDSRRARRNLQAEIPGEVFDASTTNIEEIILHFHKRPIKGGACLECIYPHDQQEDSHEQHIAEALGISKQDIAKLNVTVEAASKICSKYPALNSSNIIGISYDTLFKELCGQEKLKIQNEIEILAPFGFVSLLAGTLLAIETVRKLLSPSDYNFWKVSPWLVPIPNLRRHWPKNKSCTFCNNSTKSEFADKLWS